VERSSGVGVGRASVEKVSSQMVNEVADRSDVQGGIRRGMGVCLGKLPMTLLLRFSLCTELSSGCTEPRVAGEERGNYIVPLT
jgi:hypothetical protein